VPHFEFLWIDETIAHIADNGLSTDDAENAMTRPYSTFESKSTGRDGVRGFALDGRRIAVIFEQIDELTVFVVTAYFIDRE
jgi:hypothetical protein